MSFVVFAIAAAPAAVVAVVASTTGSRAATVCAALVAAAIGVLAGNPAYLALDLAFVAFATWFTWPPVDPKKAQAAAEARAKQEAYYESQEYKNLSTWVVVLALGGYLLYVLWPSITSPSPQPKQYSPTQVPPAAQIAPVPSQATAPYREVVQQQSVAGTEPSAPRPKRAAKSAFQKCVEISDEKKMQRCLEQLQ